MSTYEVILTDGRNDWLESVEAGSGREAVTKLLGINRLGVSVKGAPVKIHKPRSKVDQVPEHVREYLSRYFDESVGAR